ncbi:MAG: peptidylprolyl isomerase [Clostridia bacterium]|jgi:peptidylprolyl isomerase/peptidyl-prolyl cis-trans isomerase B (cyclophilin B)|nr:peptidylprolyl isomerase [Clostridia bacterium]
MILDFISNKMVLSVLAVLLIIALYNNGIIGNKGKNDRLELEIKHVPIKEPVVEIKMAAGGKMVFELLPEYAPETVQNFVNLAHAGFYDGLTFHRIVEDFMIQGGDPKGNGTGRSYKTVKGEFAENGFEQNTLKHTKGVISMARDSHPDSASCQFFIVHGDEVPSLDGSYAAFGRLVAGEETLDRIAQTPVKNNPDMKEVSRPREPVIIEKITVYERSEY